VSTFGDDVVQGLPLMSGTPAALKYAIEMFALLVSSAIRGGLRSVTFTFRLPPSSDDRERR
jgi:hypothetical protein